MFPGCVQGSPLASESSPSCVTPSPAASRPRPGWQLGAIPFSSESWECGFCCEVWFPSGGCAWPGSGLGTCWCSTAAGSVRIPQRMQCLDGSWCGAGRHGGAGAVEAEECCWRVYSQGDREDGTVNGCFAIQAASLDSSRQGNRYAWILWLSACSCGSSLSLCAQMGQMGNDSFLSCFCVLLC